MSDPGKPPRLLHLHASFDAGDVELRCARLINAFAREAGHAIVSGDPARRGGAAALDGKAKVTWPRFPSLAGKPWPGRLKKLAEAMQGYDLVCTYGWGAIAAALDQVRQQPGLRLPAVGPGRNAVGNAPHPAARLLPHLKRGPLERARGNHERGCPAERDAAIEAAPVVDVLVMDQRRELIDVGEHRVRQRRVDRAPAVRADQIVTLHRLGELLEPAGPRLAGERGELGPGHFRLAVERSGPAAPRGVARDDRVLGLAPEGVDQPGAA